MWDECGTIRRILSKSGIIKQRVPHTINSFMLYINLLGTPLIYLEEQLPLRFRTRKAQALLIYLATTGRSWTRDALATLFWPETDDATARKNLRDILPPLRRQLGGQLLVDAELIGLNPAHPIKCDVTQFTTVLEQQFQQIEIHVLADTLALYRGDFLEGYASSRISADFDLWVLRERERLHQLALMGFTALCRRQQESGDYTAALTTNRQLLKLAPWDEAAHRQQMIVLAQNGQRAAALAHFEACRHILAEELDMAPDAETIALYAEIQAGSFPKVDEQSAPVEWASPFAAPKLTLAHNVAIHHNLIAPLAAFIGRQAEKTYIQTQLLSTPDCRLLTILGPGGMGKSALALAVGQQLLQTASASFADGIFWVPLADINAADQTELSRDQVDSETVGEAILRAIAEALNTQAEIQLSSLQQLQTYLRPRQLLLILDNFEHLLTGTHALVRLLTQAPQVKVLVTSRTRLNVRGESILPLDKLSLPADLPAAAIQDLPEESEAVAMFVQRVRQLDPSFRVNGETIGPLVQICQLVEGLPLGIELATSMLPLLSCQELATELAESLDFLESSTRDLPQGQRTLQAVFERSWRLLSPEEQQLLAQLAIFPGSFHRDAATSIAGATLSLLKRLVDQSLVNKIGENRYTLHRTIHAFAEQKLQQWPTQIGVRQRQFAHFYLEFLAEREMGLFGSAYGETVTQIHADLDNIQTAWRWAVAHQMYDELNHCLSALLWYYEQQGFFADVFAMCEQALHTLRPIYEAQSCKSGTTITLLVGRLQMLWGVWSLRLGQLQQAQAAYALSCTILQEVDDAAAMAYALGFWGASLRVSDPQRSRTLMTEALQLAEATESRWMQAIIYQLFGEDNLFAGNYPKAEANIRASQAFTAQSKWVRGLTAELKIMGRICLARGNYHQAEQYLQKSIEIAQHHHLNQFHLVSLIMLGEACRLQGRFHKAQMRYMKSRVLAEALGGGLLVSPILWEEGTLAVQCQDYKVAKQLFTESLAIGLPNWWVHALPTLGWALIGLGEVAEAQTYFQSVLVDAQVKERMPIALEAQAGLAYLALLQAKSEQKSAVQYREVLTHTEATLQQICRDPATAQQTRTQIGQIIAKIRIAQG